MSIIPPKINMNFINCFWTMCRILKMMRIKKMKSKYLESSVSAFALAETRVHSMAWSSFVFCTCCTAVRLWGGIHVWWVYTMICADDDAIMHAFSCAHYRVCDVMPCYVIFYVQICKRKKKNWGGFDRGFCLICACVVDRFTLKQLDLHWQCFVRDNYSIMFSYVMQVKVCTPQIQMCTKWTSSVITYISMLKYPKYCTDLELGNISCQWQQKLLCK